MAARASIKERKGRSCHSLAPATPYPTVATPRPGALSLEPTLLAAAPNTQTPRPNTVALEPALWSPWWRGLSLASGGALLLPQHRQFVDRPEVLVGLAGLGDLEVAAGAGQDGD